MEAHSKSFHLQTPLAFGQTSLSSESTVSKSKQKHGSTAYLKSARYATTEGSFAEILEYDKHLLALKDLEELKNQYYDEYLENLEKKVIKQRREFANKDGSVKAAENDGEKIPLPKVTKLPYQRLMHDREYMRKVTKSRFYHLLAARDLMEQKGLLKSRSDEESFWNRVLHDNEIWNRPVPRDIPPETVTRVMFSRFSSVSRLRRITEHRDRNRVTFSESPSKSFPNAKDSTETDETSSNRSRDVKLLKLQVKMKLPKLHSLKNISPLPPIQPKTPTIPDSERKIKRLEKLRSIQHAYDVSMINHAATQRMLERHGFSTDEKSKFLLNDVAAFTHAPHPLHSPMKERVKLIPSRGKDNQVFITEPVYGNDKVLIPDLEYKYPPENFSAKKTVKAKIESDTEKISLDEAIDADKVAKDEKDAVVSQNSGKKEDISLPLNFSMMLAQGDLKVKEAKSSGPMWVNYLHTDDSS